MSRFLWLGVGALLLSPPIAWSQEPATIISGSRIRITGVGTGRSALHSGTVVAASADTVVLRLDTGGRTAPFPLAGISRLEVSRGQKGHTVTGVGLGFLAGAGTGAALAALACQGEDCLSGSDDMTGAFVVVSAGIGGVVGLVVGGVLGAGHKTERWEAVPSSHWHVCLCPTDPGRLALALSVVL